MFKKGICIETLHGVDTETTVLFTEAKNMKKPYVKALLKLGVFIFPLSMRKKLGSR